MLEGCITDGCNQANAATSCPTFSSFDASTVRNQTGTRNSIPTATVRFKKIKTLGIVKLSKIDSGTKIGCVVCCDHINLNNLSLSGLKSYRFFLNFSLPSKYKKGGAAR
jgi:hypothetical protein